MNDFRDRSKDRLEAEACKLIKDLMVSALDRAEKILKPDKRHHSWEQFRFGILNLGNEKMRQMADKLDDYKIEFRPQIVFGVKYISDTTQKDVEDKISEFNFYIKENAGPGIRIELPFTDKNSKLLKLIWSLVRCGVVVEDNESKTVSWDACGLLEMFDRVIPFFDENKCFKGQTLEEYNIWKEKVYKLESEGAGNVN